MSVAYRTANRSTLTSTSEYDKDRALNASLLLAWPRPPCWKMDAQKVMKIADPATTAVDMTQRRSRSHWSSASFM
jgi:hypothetical protein